LVAALNKSRQFPSHESTSIPPDIPVKKSDNQRIDSPTLDPTALDQLLNLVGGDKDKYFKLIDSFLEETPKLLEGVRKAVEKNDNELLRRMSHTLKSTSRDFGAIHLSNLGAKLEAISKADNMESAPELIGQAEMEYVSVDNALKVIRVGVDYV